MDWISVKERMPGRFVVVIVTDGDNVTTGSWQSGEHWLTEYFSMEDGTITHWMPMPEAPTGKDDNND